MKPKKTVYYDDLLHDDFAGTKITKRPLPKDYKYVRRGPFSRFFSMILYRLVAIPLLYLPVKIKYGIKVKGRKNLRLIRHQGCFFYGNHTQIIDAMSVQLFVSRRRTYIVADQDATSIRGIRTLLNLLGCIPVPENPEEHRKFIDCIQYRIRQHRRISIFPEAHIWPYSTHIRPYDDAAFIYPAELGVPAVPICVTYRERKFRKNAKPAITIHVGKPIFPDMKLGLGDRKKELRDKAYEFMLEMSGEEENVEYIQYLPRKKEEKRA